ncbi:MAG: hypothetical protein ACYS67_18585 [Planctomycetota bacterium]|jgi:hypothetical protein
MSVTKRQPVARKLFIPNNRYQASIMVNRVVIFVTLFLFLTPKICRADVATGLIEIGLPLLLFIVPIEAFVFYKYSRLRNKLTSTVKSFDKIIGGLEILAIVLWANLASSAAGYFFQFYKYKIENLMTISIAFVLSIIIEWLVYKTYFLIQRHKKAFGLFNICIIGNAVTYLIFFLPFAATPTLTSTDYDRLAMRASRNVVEAISGYYSEPTNTEFNIDLATLRKYGYKEPEREAFGIKLKMDVETKVVGSNSNPIVATWHKKGRRVYLIDKNMKLIEKLRTELEGDLKAELGF